MRSFLFLLLSTGAVWAQSTDNPPPGGSIVAQCIYNTAVPAPVAGKPFYLQCDAAGSLITNTGGALLAVLNQPTGANQNVILTGPAETLTLPSPAKNGDVIKVSAAVDTPLVVAPGASQTLAQIFSQTLAAQTSIQFIFVDGTWYRVQ